MEKPCKLANRACLPVSETAWLDARTLLSHLLDKPHSWVLAHPEEELTVEQERRLDGYLERLAQGEPLPYILGRWEFFGLDFAISTRCAHPPPGDRAAGGGGACLVGCPSRALACGRCGHRLGLHRRDAG